MKLTEINQIDKAGIGKLFLSCCGSLKWASLLANEIPFNSVKDLVIKSGNLWYNQCNENDWLEAFGHHQKIGDLKITSDGFGATEQAGVKNSPVFLMESLASANMDYQDKFGFIFLVCATGKTAAEMLRLLHERMLNSRDEELNIAMAEQQKITILRFKKLIDEDEWPVLKPGAITTHVLDTSIGKPGNDISIQLKHFIKGFWQTMAHGITNADGRIPDLLPSEKIVEAGIYKLVFNTGQYFKMNDINGFYPSVGIEFQVTDETHYHVPLLINPFGYSTYRGS